MSDIIPKIRGYLFSLKCCLLNNSIRVGSGLKMYCKLDIQGPGKVFIGKNAVVSSIIGDTYQHVTIFTHKPNTTITIGDNASLYSCRISSNNGISIGNNFLIEESGILDSDFHSIEIDRKDVIEDKEKCKIKIGDNVAIGARSFICKGVSIGDNVLVWPGSIVTKNIPDEVSVCGNPVKVVKPA